MNSADEFFRALTSQVDLDDPRETCLAQKFMIDALYRATDSLPLPAREAAAIANRYSTGVIGLREVEAERVKLWELIAGRDCSDDDDVLRIRATICVLYPPNPSEMHDRVAIFLAFWFRGGLSGPQIAATLENDYGITIDSIRPG
ncbi:hypothetical protein [Massilia sp. TSP1-1-2]|uniref:hypothetical protein n=1 Tax=unclassified Massilia TaxID=2609279 RepID=UPI003CEA21A4